MIGIDNVPAVSLVRVNKANPQWRKVNISAAGWDDSEVVAFIQWINDMEKLE